ncbi:MAG: hypothetical protein OXQ92_06465 [Boseongicola sp.]|nr:hypothetical protein [Boseongicola sp.]MDD9976587.1 hypothetical protein [Boseongicola sp.]
MMRLSLALGAFAILTACGVGSSTTKYTCANGPDLTARYSENTVELFFADGRTETLVSSDPSRPDFYFSGTVSWSAGEFVGRLTDGRKSYLCDAFSA